MKKWETLRKLKVQSFDKAQDKSEKLKVDQIINILLENRGLKTKKEIDEFLNPKLENVTSQSVNIDQKQLKKAIKRIQKAIKNNEQIIVYGDYDVDGICGTAILWETLHELKANALPYIPHRIDEGYGLSIKGIQNVILNLFQDLKSTGNEMPKQVRHDTGGLIITVDNGIVANSAVDFANKQGIDVIITDHHVPSSTLPKALTIVHTTMLCGTGVAYLLSKEILHFVQNDNEGKNHLELVALATVADLVPLVGSNRTLLKYGLEELRKTKRVGLLELFKESTLDKTTIGTYEIGHVIAPRLNAMGRLEYAMESLRLLCTNNKKRAEDLAHLLGATNRERQLLTQETVQHAKSTVNTSASSVQAMKKLLFISHESYQQGVIGLVAGKLVEEFYRPAIVVSKGEKHSKASARSIHGFNIIEFIRMASEFLVDAGGHPMAAGFTVETEKLFALEEKLHKLAEKLLDEDMLTRLLRIDIEIPSSLISEELYSSIQQLAPFGMGNPELTFSSKGLIIQDMRLVGKEGKHVKFRFLCHPERSEGSHYVRDSSAKPQNDMMSIDGIAFGMGERVKKFKIGDEVEVAYALDINTWNGDKKLQLKVKDIR